jgi:hypothetical protein
LAWLFPQIASGFLVQRAVRFIIDLRDLTR